MAKGSRQTNRWLGECTLALHQGGTHGTLPEVPWVSGGSQNHRLEASSVALRAYDSGPPAARALNQALDRMETQRVLGHGKVGAGTSELLTDSHDPIWKRGMASMHTTAFERRGRSPSHRRLFNLTRAWWGGETYLCSMLRVPEGPREGEIVGVGARFASGQNKVRDICHALITGADLPDVGARFWSNATRFQDTFACILVRDMVAKGALDGMRVAAPALPFSYEVDRCEGGHVSRVPEGALDDKSPTVVWVRYADGEIGQGDPPELGRIATKVRIGS